MTIKAAPRLIAGLLLALGFWLFVAGNKLSTTASESSVAAQASNLIKNPGFEGGFHAWSGIPEVQVAADWTPWWREDPDHNPAYFRPEYKRALASVFPKRVLSGESAQQWFTFHASHVAGMYQQVFNVVPGQRYRFSIWAQVWSSSEDNPNESVLPANPHLQIGIDPTGNWNPGAATVMWSGEAPMSGVIDQWGLMILEATADNNVITIFMRTNPDFANKHNDMYWDNAGLEAVQPPPPTMPPSPTLGAATNTPVATATAAATFTPAATNTQVATATETASPTSTPTPTEVPPTTTETAPPTLTNTAVPTPSSMPRATATIVVAAVPETPTTPSSQLSEEGYGAITDDTEMATERQSGESDSESDGLGNVALVGIAVSIGLLLVLIYILLKALRQNQT
jgi:hypothetical protein